MARRLLAAIALIITLPLAAAWAEQPKEARSMLDAVTWLGHDTFKIKAGKLTLYTDPFKLAKADTADIILITHEHRDHCSPEDVSKVWGPDTMTVTVADCAAKLKGDVKIIKPGDTITVKGVTIQAVPAYNTNKQFHPKQNSWVGYIFTMAGVSYYIAGDTDYIPEMKGYRCDVAFLPVSGTYVMTAEEAVQAALDIKPKVAVPMHYGSIVGVPDDAKRFEAALKGKIPVVVLEQK